MGADVAGGIPRNELTHESASGLCAVSPVLF